MITHIHIYIHIYTHTYISYVLGLFTDVYCNSFQCSMFQRWSLKYAHITFWCNTAAIPSETLWDSFLLCCLNIPLCLEFWSEHRADRIWTALGHLKRTLGWECSSVVFRVLAKNTHEALVLSLAPHTTVRNIHKVKFRDSQMTWATWLAIAEAWSLKGTLALPSGEDLLSEEWISNCPIPVTIQTNSWN